MKEDKSYSTLQQAIHNPVPPKSIMSLLGGIATESVTVFCKVFPLPLQ